MKLSGLRFYRSCASGQNTSNLRLNCTEQRDPRSLHPRNRMMAQRRNLPVGRQASPVPSWRYRFRRFSSSF
ncbi:hypothetical protein KCP73_08005 [Salmonella enterica subsp. enterica]|nr:hypothetical protein KCP73_08005 [Salmonella enterica subsp. enterica]